ncbi:NAD-dependent succinate-semialdehyde dehydrogenase [Leptolyngbya cf. ectocarpi LEGE 11479]|uniref:NAD-dependent succinate-semialdehyde dehydrogenase n=1 Tax=Leptolyngbya cf. ectocarpi LEGE 11479 TaxID=1828722 RepID=A0A928ZU97_LEPEC|nr:NAD-dependent succinate-semialdehyde dehydrogenase [Leptolyngbya ectocarpi]MBE9067559.1 NAD-dependent succinate-semialdehyde dehydrogenase [Leptolyngbya cf. ectocarpi LEGE 11479]
MAIKSVNPATGKVYKTYAPLTSAEIEQRLAAGEARYQQYRWTLFSDRSAWLQAAADYLDDHADVLGRIMTQEMGKTLGSAIAEVKKCAWVCRHYAENGADYLADERSDVGYVRYQPLGIILAVMPWNYPLWQVFRLAAPALMAGNVVLLKHASNVPKCALSIEQIFQKAGFPDGVFQTLLIGAEQTAAVIADERVRGVSLTGSGPAGAQVAATAGQHLKKAVLELGGSDPFIVLPSANLEIALETAVTARLQNNGQSCIAAKRFILVGNIADEFEARLVEKYQALVVGDPMQPETDIGPLATPSILRDIHKQVHDCLIAGAKALYGGNLEKLKTSLPPELELGNFYPPTILSHIPPGTPADQEEFFGPVALIFRVPDLDAAIALANSTPFGLGASGWTQDPTEQQRLVNELEAGAVFVNSMVKSDPRLPFGGIKQSGIGRELGRHGILEFVNAKTVCVE